MDPLRIGIVCYPTVGGSGVVATEIAIQLARAGHEVHLLSYDRPARLKHSVPGVHYHGVQVSAYPLFRYPPYDLALATRMLEVQEEAGVDLFTIQRLLRHGHISTTMRYLHLTQSRLANTASPLELLTPPERPQ